MMLLTFSSILSVITALLILVHGWRSWRLYYYSYFIKGPFWLPVLGSPSFALGYRNVVKKSLELRDGYGDVFKFWAGLNLYIGVSDPKVAQTVLQNRLEKSPEFEMIFPDNFKHGLLLTPAETWREHRKIINTSFKTNVINSSAEIIARHANDFVESLKLWENKEIDVLPIVWKYILDNSCESLLDVDPKLVKEKEQIIRDFLRSEDLSARRLQNPLYYFNISWKLLPAGKEHRAIQQRLQKFVKGILELKVFSDQKRSDDDSSHKGSVFLNHLMGLDERLSDEEFFSEVDTMTFASSETSAFLISSVMMVLGMYPEAQEKIFEELGEIFEDSERPVTLDDLRNMKYLENVIKESMRILPPVPIISRLIDKDLKIGSHFFPAGSRVLINIYCLHTNPTVWPDPWKFDPDRFSTSQIERCSLIPFSFGARDCIGRVYGMMSAKIILSTLLRNFKIKHDKYKDVRDIKFDYGVMMKPEDGFRVILERRQ